MKQAKSALFVCLITCLLVGAFLFGRDVRLSAMAPMREANALGSQQAARSNWTVEALGGSSSAGQTVTIPNLSSDSKVADNAAGEDTDSDDFDSVDSPLVTFEQVYEDLKEDYVDKIPSETPLAHGAVSAMIAALDDPNSRFLDPTERTALEAQGQGVFAGTGIVFTVQKVIDDGLPERLLTVIDPVTSSPAEAAGIKTGDVITDINGQWVISYDPFAAESKLFKSLTSDPVSYNHEVDSIDAKIKSGLTLPAAQALLDTVQTAPLTLSILRNGVPVKITVDGSKTTAVTDVESKVLADGNGYIQFRAFTDSTTADFLKAFSSVNSAPGIVIDLRNCPGGDIDPALNIGQALAPNLPMGSIVVRDNNGATTDPAGFKVRSEPLAYNLSNANSVAPLSYSGHLVVLVNSGTANTAELLAAFLHDRLGARIVGSTTFGDGMAQTLFPMPDGSGFTLTTGLVKTTSNVSFASVGIKPDDVLAEIDADGDAALQQAEQDLTLKPLNTLSASSSPSEQKS